MFTSVRKPTASLSVVSCSVSRRQAALPHEQRWLLSLPEGGCTATRVVSLVLKEDLVGQPEALCLSLENSFERGKMAPICCDCTLEGLHA